MITRIGSLYGNIRRLFSRSEWVIALLRLSHVKGQAASPGLVMVQIDGLSRAQFEKALQEGNMPFLKRLLEREHYGLKSLYSGLPSNTPAVQAEIFYGVKCAVPAFCFMDVKSGRVFRMYDQTAAQDVEGRLEKQGQGLLRGGSSYSNVFTGGAEAAHFCASNLGWGLLRSHPFAMPFLFMIHLDVAFRVVVLLAIELVLALFDCVRGTLAGKIFWQELKFISARVGICVLLRELVRIGASIDIARGLPVIHLNLLGYDEQAHRRGPASSFAHWSLRGIDDTVRRLWKAAQQSSRRSYDLWVYSDHGQETTRSYHQEQRKSIHDVVGELFGRRTEWENESESHRTVGRMGFLDMARVHKEESEAVPENAERVIVAAMGPVGHVYPTRALDPAEKERIASSLVKQAGIPMVMTAAAEPGKATVWSAEGVRTLPDDAAQILGEDHPFLEEAGADLAAVANHPDAGAFVLLGWKLGEPPLSFPLENGSHAGPGPEETHAFALLSQDAPLDAARPYLRPADIRSAAERLLGRSTGFRSAARPRASARTLRVMTYNVHGCVGMDGKLSPDRIARVIARHDADVIALQELDCGRARSGGIDQAEAIARRLEMAFHFHPVIIGDGGKYGNAVFSRYPMHLVQMEPLPAGRKEFEPRGALWVEIDVGPSKVQFVTTHLSIWPGERLLQASTLAGPQWLQHPKCTGNVVLCGDFNALPGTSAYRKIGRILRDTQLNLNAHRPHYTWRYPLSRIDHVFVGPNIQVTGIRVPLTELDKNASDHLPLVVEIRLPEENQVPPNARSFLSQAIKTF